MNPAEIEKIMNEAFTDAQLSRSLFATGFDSQVPTATTVVTDTDNDAEELKARLSLNTTKPAEDKK